MAFRAFLGLVLGMAERAYGLLPKPGLKTAAEQVILKNLQALEAELNETTSLKRKEELFQQISLLKEQLIRLQGPEYSVLQRENLELKARLAALEKASAQAGSSAPKSPGTGAMAPETELEKKLKLYALLLKKYAALINEKERKTVGEVKALVNKDDLAIDSQASQFKGEGYAFEKDYLKAAKAAYSFVVKELDYVKADVELNFWLAPTEIMKEKVADDEDLAVFLCACLYALGDEKAEVVIAELENLSTHAFNVTYADGKFLLLDPSQKAPFEKYFGDKKKVLQEYAFEGAHIKRFLYKFNARDYEQFI